MPKKLRLFLRVIEKLTNFSYGSLLLLWLLFAILFGAAYFMLAVFVPVHGPTQLIDDPTLTIMFFDSMYYSVITATSTGYGDITPQGFSKLLASLQSITALLIWAIFVTKLVSHKQEAALKEVHRLTFEDVFHNIREGLFIMRKDFDRIVEDAEEHGSLTEDHWMDMFIAYKQGQSLLQEIPDFYANDNDDQHTYTLDHRREQLLHEAVHRTLHRLNDMLNVLSKKNIPWASKEESLKELSSFIKTVDVITPLWQQESPYTEAFEDILHLNDIIQKKMKEALPRNDDDKKEE